jgi:hypothetical protein
MTGDEAGRELKVENTFIMSIDVKIPGAPPKCKEKAASAIVSSMPAAKIL